MLYRAASNMAAARLTPPGPFFALPLDRRKSGIGRERQKEGDGPWFKSSFATITSIKP
jgi:hypothetical protein